MDLSAIRKPYQDKSNVFLEDHIEVKEPFWLFAKWFNEVKNEPSISEPNAVCVSTATKSGLPSARFMLCKGFDKSYGFKLFTNMDSRKGQELKENPNAALTFYWEIFNRSVRVEGTVKLLDDEEAEAYFKKRPHVSQIGAVISKQSWPVANRKVLEDLEVTASKKYSPGEAPKPPSWGGFAVVPHTIEFWQGQTCRIHDRIRFRRPREGEPDGVLTHQGEDGWIFERLNP